MYTEENVFTIEQIKEAQAVVRINKKMNNLDFTVLEVLESEKEIRAERARIDQQKDLELRK